MTSASPIRLAVINDYEVVVRGVHAMLAPFPDRVAVVELESAAAQEIDAAGLETQSPGSMDEAEELLR